MTWKTTAIVHVTIAVPVGGLAEHAWATAEVAREAKARALEAVREVCKPLGKIETLRVTAVMTEGEPEDVKET